MGLLIFTSFCELTLDNHLMFVHTEILIYHPSLEVELSLIAFSCCSTWLTTHLGNMPICHCTMKIGAMGRLVSCMRSVSHTVRHLYTPSIPRFNSEPHRYIHSQPAGPKVVLHEVGRACTPWSGRGCNEEYQMSSVLTQCGSKNYLAYYI